MYKTLIADGIVRYSFDAHPGKHFSDNIYTLISGGKALLIDTGFEPEGEQVREDLENSGLELAGVIISHFHDDHMQGLKALSKVPVYGSKLYQKTLDLWTEESEHGYFTPDILVEDAVVFDFGEHCVSIIPNSGHSACTVLVCIDGAYLHVSDEIMFSPDQQPILPVADPGCLKGHIESLQKLKAYSGYTFLPAHGQPMRGAEEIERQIDSRLVYLTAILNAHGRISYEEAAKGSSGFLHSEWHGDNCAE